VSESLLRVRRLHVEFDRRAALRDVSFDLHPGETLGLVGESGSGKSTLARAVLRLVRATGGSVEWHGEDILSCPPRRLRALRRDMQIVFQNPLASLNPRMTIAEAIAEPLRIFEPRLDAATRAGRVCSMLERVGLNPDMGGRYPHEFSGGQCQRVGIARAMILNPRLLICDEPVSSLDVSIQGQIVNLLADLQNESGTAMLFISHNLAVVRHLSRRILVIYQGRCIESAGRDELFAQPLHPYSLALLAAAAAAVPLAAAAAAAAAPAASDAPALPPPVAGTPSLESSAGCAYRDRCAHAIALCESTQPPLAEITPGHLAACHRAREFLSAR
jgi:oligopeptide transport system ATP-binding protein